MKVFLSVSFFLSLSLVVNVQAQNEDSEHFPDAGFVYEFFASDYCDPIPSEMDPVELAEMRQLIVDDEYPMVLAELEGFMTGEHFGVSPFGFAAPGRGFASVATIWGEHEELGILTLCLAMIQVGDEAVEPGSSRLVGVRQIDMAEPGDMLAAGWVITLNPTERLSASGDPIYRLQRIGELVVSQGSFNLTSADELNFEGGFSLEGWVVLNDDEQRYPLTLQTTAAGENIIDKVPSLTQDDDPAEPQALPPELARDYSRMPVSTTTREQRQRPRLDHDAPSREAFYNLLQIDLPRQAEAVIEGDVDSWDWQQGRQFSDFVQQRLPYSLNLHQLVHRLVDLRDQSGEEFAIVWDPERMELAVWFEFFDEQARYVSRSMNFSFDQEGAMTSRGASSMSTGNPPDSYAYADNFGVLFGDQTVSVDPEPAPIVRVALERDAPPRETFYHLLNIDLPRKAEAGADSTTPDWEAVQKAAFEARIAELFPADMPPQAVAERLMALRESVGEVSALLWDPNRRSLIVKYEYEGGDGYMARTMDFLFNEADEQVFFSVGSEWGRSAPRTFPASDELGVLVYE